MNFEIINKTRFAIIEFNPELKMSIIKSLTELDLPFVILEDKIRVQKRLLRTQERTLQQKYKPENKTSLKPIKTTKDKNVIVGYLGCPITLMNFEFKFKTK